MKRVHLMFDLTYQCVSVSGRKNLNRHVSLVIPLQTLNLENARPRILCTVPNTSTLHEEIECTTELTKETKSPHLSHSGLDLVVHTAFFRGPRLNRDNGVVQRRIQHGRVHLGIGEGHPG